MGLYLGEGDGTAGAVGGARAGLSSAGGSGAKAELGDKGGR